jgi:hypothetical protein
MNSSPLVNLLLATIHEEIGGLGKVNEYALNQPHNPKIGTAAGLFGFITPTAVTLDKRRTTRQPDIRAATKTVFLYLSEEDRSLRATDAYRKQFIRMRKFWEEASRAFKKDWSGGPLAAEEQLAHLSYLAAYHHGPKVAKTIANYMSGSLLNIGIQWVGLVDSFAWSRVLNRLRDVYHDMGLNVDSADDHIAALSRKLSIVQLSVAEDAALGVCTFSPLAEVYPTYYGVELTRSGDGQLTSAPTENRKDVGTVHTLSNQLAKIIGYIIPRDPTGFN